MEPGVQFIEELLPIEVSDYHVLRFTEDSSNQILGNQQWSQTCYLNSSLLICRVKGNMLDIQQLFTHCNIPEPTSNLQKYQLDALESAPTLRFIFKQPIVPNLDFLIESEIYTLYVATSDGSIFKLEFQQNIPFTSNNEYLKGYNCYLVPNCQATSVCLLRQGKEADSIKDVICLGTENGSYFVATLMSSDYNENIILPSSVIQVDTPFNLVSKFTSFFRSATHERILRVINLKSHLLLTISSSGMLRLWNSERYSLICELDIKVRDLTYLKTAKYVQVDKKYLALSYTDNNLCIVSLFNIESDEIKHQGDFLGRPGEEVKDIALGIKGLWIVWKCNVCRVVQYSLDRDIGGEVYTWEDTLQKYLLEDKKSNEVDDPLEYLLQRITVTGRFNFTTINQAFCNVFGKSEQVLDETKIKKTIYKLVKDNTNPIETLIAILEECIGKQEISYDIISIAYSEDDSYTLPIILRENNAIGIVRKPSCWIEKLSLASSKLTTQYSNLLANSLDKDKDRILAEFKIKNEGKGMSIVINSVRLWRLSFNYRLEQKFESCFYNGLQHIYETEIPYNLQLLIIRHLPNNWHEFINKEIDNTQEIIGTKSNSNSQPSTSYWTPFAVSMISRSVCTSIEAIYEYLLDLLTFTIISSKLSSSIQNPNTESLICRLIGIVYPLFSVSRTLKYSIESLNTSGFWSSCASIYYFPLNVCVALTSDRRDSLLGLSSGFNYMYMSHWMHSSILRVIKLCTFTIPFIANTSSPYLLSFLIENTYSEAALYFLTLMKEKNAGIVYMKGLAYLQQNDFSHSSKELLSVDSLIDIDYNTNAEFYNGPWIRKDQSPLRDRSGFDINAVYHTLLWKNIRDSKIRQQVMIGSLMTYSQTEMEDKLMGCFNGLVEVGDYLNAMNCVMDIKDEDKVRECLGKLVDAIYSTACVRELVKIQFSPYHKDIIDEILKRKSEEQNFDLIRTICTKQYFQKASKLFREILHPDERAVRNRVPHDWNTIRYVFCLRNYDYKQAAESMFRQYDSILTFLKTTELPLPEVEFLMSLIKEALLLTTVCLRSLPRDEAFIVSKKLRKTSGMKRDHTGKYRPEFQEYEKGELATLSDIENLLFAKLE